MGMFRSSCTVQTFTEDYYEITKRLLETSKKFTNGKVVSILEGGYDLLALKDSAKRHVDALLEFN